MISRRQFLKLSAATGAGLAVPWRLGQMVGVQRAFAAYVADNTLNPADVFSYKYQDPMVIPPAMPMSKGSNKNKAKYKIAVRQFGQQILPTGQYDPTTVWSYGSTDFPGTVGQGGTFNYPAFTIEALWNTDTQVQWRNELVDGAGMPLPHLLPVDPTLHWANPIGARDTRPDPADAAYWANPYLNGVNGAYSGPVPMVVHVHGAHTTEDSDGYPEAWYLPATAAGVNWLTGTYFDLYNAKYGHGWTPGAATFKYPNTQRATTLWYHDHTLGMTRLNVYAGPAGFWLIRGGPDDQVTGTLPGPAPNTATSPINPPGIYEIPIVIQDRSFDTNGQLWYPYYRAFFEGLGDVPDFLQIPFTPNAALNGVASDVAPIWQPEFFGNVMVVNGVAWPHLNVEKELYRFRLLNGCNSRFLILDFGNLPVYQIGADGGFLDAPKNIANNLPFPGQILMGPAERADVIVDFRGASAGDQFTLRNLGPDEPFGGDSVQGAGDMPEMREVMQFRVTGDSTSPVAFTDPDQLVLPAIAPLAAAATRKVSLNEDMSHAVFVPFDADADEFVLDTNGTLWEVPEGAVPAYNSDSGFWEFADLPGVTWDRSWAADVFGPTAALLGDIDVNGVNTPRLWMAQTTETPTAGSVEEWEIHNFTVDAHPIHIHLVQFQVVGRYAADGTTLISGPEQGETGFKDTVIAYPGQVTKVRAQFDIPGRFVWHCHIVEHEDNEMMRPYDVV
jgi:spore coat protein A